MVEPGLASSHPPGYVRGLGGPRGPVCCARWVQLITSSAIGARRMVVGPENRLALRLRRALPLVALALVLVAWGASLAGRHRVGRLDLSGFGRCEDVHEALARDGYV